MKIVGMMPVRNEAHVLGLSARAALRWVDELIVQVHASTDGTAELVEDLSCEYPGRVWVASEDDPRWREMEQRQHLLLGARQREATHIAIVDADEVLTGNLLPSIRENIGALKPGYILQLPGFNLRGSIGRYHSTGIWANRFFSMAFPDDERAHWRGDRLHQREPMGFPPNLFSQPISHSEGGILHLWGANERRLVAKHALYKLTERIQWPQKPIAEIDALYNLAICGQDCWQYAEVPAEWWGPYADLMHHVDLDGEPWQERYCRQLVEQHGAAKFAGLDLFGVA